MRNVAEIIRQSSVRDNVDRIKPFVKVQEDRRISSEWFRNKSFPVFDFNVRNIEENLRRKEQLVNNLKKEVCDHFLRINILIAEKICNFSLSITFPRIQEKFFNSLI